MFCSAFFLLLKAFLDMKALRFWKIEVYLIYNDVLNSSV